MKSVTRTLSATSTKTSSRSVRSSVSCMSMLSTARSKNRSQFADCYTELCEIQHSHPITAIKQNLDKGMLDFYADRIRFEEWWSIVNALSHDKTLHLIAIRLRHAVQSALDTADTELKAKGVTKQPVVTTRFVLLWLMEAVKLCLSHSSTLTVLELEGLPLGGDYLDSLARGLSVTTSLQHLSLYKCNIQDQGTEVVCMAIKNLPSVVSLDLSYCGLTDRGAEIISNLIRYQKLNRYSEAWKQTLRYRDPDVEAMPGIRRITINSNPEVGDKGVEFLAEEIKDDLWLRAIDVQDCGLTEEGGRVLLDMVETNTNLVIVDSRGNPFINEDLLSAIMNTLATNNADKPQTQYKWISKSPHLNKKCHQVSNPKLRPWSCQNLRNYSRGPPPSECGSIRSLRRSNTTLNQSNLSLIKQNRPDRITDYERLNIQLRDFTVILSQEVQEKLALMEENKQLKEALEKCEKEKAQLLEAQQNKILIDENTLKTLEETIARFGNYITEEEEESEEGTTGRSGEDNEIPELVSSLKMLLRNAANETSAPHQRHKEKPKRTKSGVHEKIFLDIPREVFQQEPVPEDKPAAQPRTRPQRTRQRQNDLVIWEEEEGVQTPVAVRPRIERNETNKSKAQVMFARMLESKQSRPATEKQKRSVPSDSASDDSDYDSKSADVPEKPLTSSEEETSS